MPLRAEDIARALEGVQQPLNIAYTFHFALAMQALRDWGITGRDCQRTIG